ncbi:ATP-binding cassette sub-family A member 2 [Eurytemora carolleeae]|uniref:ATP-binding cassette sub-family A member 2 n=1 Tax=Eurytemora carolleeae TaxID=1294199 RepID=UPI000C7727D7|nr:ATP-binding cassette sub-family A member 2 [Eurytemora carolleeae]|eukprot:XP_023327394.1 ATP-binding cassette sub-family A member 2-like [Eurytemora affinis]
MVMCLISNIGFGFGCAYFSHYEESGIGAQWENVWVSPLLGDSFSLAGCMGMLLIDSALYGILTWYIEAVFPGEFGVPKPFYFFLTLSYWTGRSRRILQYDSEPDIRMGERPKHTESEPTHLKLGVSIKHLHKVYNNGKIAVEDLNLNFYEGQITSFLGHNGAGKTTTISILTGLFPPSAGTALINGLDITKDMDEIRNSMGTCPQHNVLFQQLTVEEHLWFFARIKNQPKEGLNDQITQMINDLGIPHKRHALSKDLSGGMQRKLSIACAFVGGSKVVVLDEPTAGVDPYSRRAIWDLLIKYKGNRTIILTTHFMDEADLLGDRIAIINCGKLVCSGSSLFLKSLYGVGYYLTLVKAGATENTGKDQFIDIMKVRTAGSSANTSRDDDDGIEDIDDDEGISDVSTKDTIINPSSGNSKYPTYPLTKFIQRFVPNAALVEEIGQEIVFVLPVEETKEISMKQFELLFNELDLFMNKMNISSYGLSDTTLEEIFLKVASNENDGEIVRGNTSAIANKLRRRSLLSSSVVKNIGTAFTPEKVESGSRKVKVMPGESTAYPSSPLGAKQDSEVQIGDSESHVLTSHKNPSELQIVKTGKPLVLKHIMALEIKRFHHSKRNKKGFMCEILLPAAFVCLAMGFTMILPPLVEEPEMEMSPWLYPGKGGPNYIYYSNSLPGYPTDWPNRYTDALLSSDSAGTKCVGPNKNKCDSSTLQYKNLLLKYSSNITTDDSKNPPCTCSIGTQICPEGATGPSPPSIKIPTGDILINMTSRNISQWSIKTEDQFVKQRYGGFEFGVKNPMILKNMTLMREVFERIVAAANQGRNVFSGFVEATAVDALFGYIDTLLDPNMFDNIRIWFNNKGWAASVAYMNAVNNIVLRATVKQTEEDDVDAFLNDFDSSTDNKYDTSQYGIRLISHPMNYTETQLDKELIRQVGIRETCIHSSFIHSSIHPPIHPFKNYICLGVNPSTYWVSALLWDLIMYTASASLCVIIFLIFDADAYVSEDNLGPLVLLLLLYGFASVPLMYPASFVFSVPSSAFVTLACANLFIGIITTITTFVLENFDDVELKNIGNICKKVFLIFPHYCLGRGLMDMATEQSINSVIAKFGLISVRSRFEFDFLGKYFLWMFVQGIVFFLATLAIQSEFWTWRLKKDETETKVPEEIEDLDEDVEKERSRILNSQGGSDVLQTKNLFKRYNKNIRQAVDNLTFGVSKGECFGLLGVNGAGKTTTFKMMTGDTDVTAGEAFVGGYSILRDMDKVRSSLGYCPQFDALDSLLTGREHLTLYARLRGLDEASVKRATEWGLKKLGLVAYSDRCAGTYSGGNKRKLSTAIALVGNPSIVFLDEPTSGMDPGARRFLWNSILEMIKGGQSVVLTSHSMEECEALCSRLGIMVNGQFKCLGSIQHLKNRFGSGYTLTIRCEEGKGEEMSARMSVLLPLAELKEEHYNQLQFQLPVIGTKLPAVFRHMEDLRAQGFLEDYSLTQTTLDEVFVRFAKEQTDLQEDEIKPKNLKQKILDTMTNKKN